jgi:hypothetical protein
MLRLSWPSSRRPLREGLAMKKPVALVITVWGLAFASAAFAYAVHRPVTPTDSQQATGGPRASPSLSLSNAAEETSVAPVEEDALELSPTVIVGRPPSAAAARDLSEMRCRDWRPLTQGAADGMVRYCD